MQATAGRLTVRTKIAYICSDVRGCFQRHGCSVADTVKNVMMSCDMKATGAVTHIHTATVVPGALGEWSCRFLILLAPPYTLTAVDR